METLINIIIALTLVATVAISAAIAATIKVERLQRKLDIIFALAKTRNNTVYEILASEDAE